MKSLKRDPLVVLLEQKGFHKGDYEFYFTTGEGAFFPVQYRGREVENCSGSLVTLNLDHYFFWMEWDESKQEPYFSKWRKEKAPPIDKDTPDEYVEALYKIIGRRIRQEKQAQRKLTQVPA